MKTTWKKKEYALIAVVVILFAVVSCLSLTSIGQMRGTARVVNYAGIVRGATQRLVKQELQGHPNDALIARLDSIINDLINGGGPNELVALRDNAFQSNMIEVRQSWGQLKEQIDQVRQGKDNQSLFDLSEEYFNLVDKTVSSAETYSESQVQWSVKVLIGVDLIFVVLILIGIASFLRSAGLKNRAEALGKLAYLDILTQMPNRASCEREIDNFTQTPPDEKMAAFMFDMNNLKRANDVLGHQGGDRIIADFARILKNESKDYGFAGRFGGDEFIAIFPDCDVDKAERFLSQLNDKIIAYNLLHISQVEKISFAAGYKIDVPSHTSVTNMINEADRKMYERKRQMKENKEA